MALSPTAARALEQVKMGLYMLRGADYFTEEEWIKIDGLIHKGRYVFTNGPQQQHVLDQELISFDDINEQNDFSVQIPPRAFNTIKAEIMEVSERQVHSPMSDPADLTDLETPNTTSAEVSSDDEPSLPNTTDKTSTTTSQPAEPTPTPKREPVARPINGGLSFYTQAQLDEVNAFNSGLTKAGQKSKPGKHKKNGEESYPPSAWSQNEASEPAAYQTPTPSEHATRSQIQTWASDVQAQDASPSSTPEIAAPAPTKTWTATPPLAPKPIIEAFKKTHGHSPKSINDIAQPNNPEFRPLTARPVSRVSHKSAKSSAKSATPVPPSILNPHKPLHFKPGVVIIAPRDVPKMSPIHLEIKAGDQIKVCKHVSGITHGGENLRTKQRGQFTEDAFKKGVMSAETLIQQQRAALSAKSVAMTAMSVSTVSNGLERIEGINAQEWDDVKYVSEAKTSMPARPNTVQPQILKPTAIGLGASRFADEDESVKSGSENHEFQGMSKEEINQLFDERLAKILAAQQPSTLIQPPKAPWTLPRKPPITDPLKKVTPKTATCWWWATPNKECRFTADECRDLHAYLPATAAIDPANLRMGKPTWGALADSLPAKPPTGSENSEEGPSGQANTGPFKSKTCWYWANDASGCNNSAEECKYLHERSPAGVANKPNAWKKLPWNRFASPGEKEGGCAWTVNGDGEMDGGGEVREQVVETARAVNEWGYLNKTGPSAWAAEVSATVSLSGWGADSDKYKPPHIKALEEKALVEAVGW
ncbi:uncharacterized protein LY89DRAFT_686732 [Mollisia scopiformis]|uniref:C3H1-type domain-containing protein n=1 Tax=Mollisia scopiformis TaxID=149040 RepID=A0A194X313_MOLSC|nr:uncharacterized protein LY89DRAFT_686732 [Mollisia scopiformis]KUJ14222.1 hypothetical protein LY89DRAFT_686732 [Mollisia scopiformis]